MGAFKSFPIQADEHLLAVCRYVERNPLRANLVAAAQAWRWSSLGQRAQGGSAPTLAAGPVPLPADWVRHVNAPQTEAELEALRRSVVRGMPFGHSGWQQDAAVRLGLESTLRTRGRPRKTQATPPK